MKGDVLYVKIQWAEILFPQSEWAPKSVIRQLLLLLTGLLSRRNCWVKEIYRAYPYYENLDYFIIWGISYYEQIIDERSTIIEAKKNFSFVINNYLNTEYALDCEFKIDLINDTLASKEII